ncbi:sulfatase-like hydrolase/transferase [Caulobacter sp. SLTY]|uniref:sulfatase-like hydrolase/transferase n=1 Tax=Caulobacter sp. SLTY TaxID=2683262 RepID=UPI0014123B5A|nr:sulfatase-like hydrolase/transferase [Caulobacter sp. SLTY]NBB15918.1 sulfatase-like hydrolase/transferase [Caulobacter sp. SLTY]
MKSRTLISLAVAAVVVGGGGYLAFQNFKIYLPGIIGRLKNPIGPNQPVTWATGPDAPPSSGGAPAAQRPPNIILIVADDLGINDVTATGTGVFGKVPTPHIDSIAKTGVRFANGYSANATCSPSRAAMMTGRYPTRFGFEFTAVPKSFAREVTHVADGPIKPVFYADRAKDMPQVEKMGVPTEETTVAEALKGQGYRTLHIGKWHLGESPAMQPTGQGFDESLAILAGAGMFLKPNDPNVVNSKQEFDPIDRYLWPNLPYSVRWNGGKPFEPKGYVTDYFGDEAVKAIQANANRPFFLYLAFNAPHTPLQSTKEDYDALSDIPDHTARVYGGMIRSLDRNVGKVLAELDRLGLAENTIVIFTSDNGGANYIGLPDINKPYRGWKATFFEGGVNVPFFMKWPARLAPGQVAPSRAMHIDIFATAASAAGAPVGPKVDGVDLLTLAQGKGPARPLFFRSGHYRSVIFDNWKLQTSERPKKTWLFNLAADPTEQNNLAGREPARQAQLAALLDEQDRRAGKPLWPALVEAPFFIDQPLNKERNLKGEYVMWAN